MTGLHTDAYRRFVTALGAARRAAKLTQRELASLLEVDNAYIAKYEVGRQRLDFVEFLRVCDAIGCDPKDIIDVVRSSGDLK